LDSTSYYERCAAQKALELNEPIAADKVKALGVVGRLHAVWILARRGDAGAVEGLWFLAKSDPEPRVQAQAIRALADVTDPVLVRHRLDAGAGDEKLAIRMAELGVGKDSLVVVEVVVALGRLRWPKAPAWLAKNVQPSDPALAHAAQWTLRRANNWPGVLKLLDEPASVVLRAVALRALADQYEASVMDGLIERLDKESSAARRREYADALTRIHKKPASWTYWGFRPPPRPAPTVAWPGTEKIEKALDRVLCDQDVGVRRDILARMVREKIPTRLATLTLWLDQEQDANNVAALLTALSAAAAADSRPALESVLANKKHSLANRRQAAALYVAGLDAGSEGRLLALAKIVEDGSVLADLLRAVAARPTLPGAAALFSTKLNSSEAEIRACAIEGLATLMTPGVRNSILQALKDPDPRVRRAAAQASGQLGIKDAADLLLILARAGDPQSRSTAFQALRRLREPRAVALAVAALDDRDTALAGLELLEDLGGPEQIGAVTQLARRELAAEVLAAAAKVLVGWAEKTKTKRDQIDDALADLHGHGGVLLAWQVQGVGSAAEAKKIADAQADQKSSSAPPWRLALAAGLDARLRIAETEKPTMVWLGMADVHASEAGLVEFAAASSGLATIWVNGVQAYRRDRPGVIGPYPDRFDVKLSKGRNRVVLMLTDFKGPPEWQVRLRGKSAAPEIERFTAASLARAGNPARGREVFLNAEKSLCVKCHRVGDQGECIGPELTGLGSRFSKVHIIESILQPNRTIAPSYESYAIALKNGKVLTGVKVAETDASITLADNQATKHVFAKNDIDQQQRVPISAMPDGVERRLSEDDFVDLVSFLVNLKEKGR
jgi:putative heme-binding domain-containing protein